MSLRGILRGFGLKVGRTTKVSFPRRIVELTEHHPALKAIAKALLAAHEVLLRELNGFEKQVRKLARGDARVRLAMTAPGVGGHSRTDLRFGHRRSGPVFIVENGWRAFRYDAEYQSGQIDVTGRIFKMETRACARCFTRPRMSS